MSQLDGKWVQDNTLKGTKIRLDNQEALRARNFADTADINIGAVDASDEFLFSAKPKFAGTPANNDDLVNKAYLLDALAGIRDPKDAVKVASTANTALSGLGAGAITIDGVSLSNGDRVLLKDQTTPSENGIYTIGNIGVDAAFTRATDADADEEVTQGMSCLVVEGTVNARKLYVLTTADPITVGVTGLTFIQAPNPANFLVPKNLVKTLDGTDISNGYIDLAHEAENESISISVLGGIDQEYGADFTLSVVSNVTRITFAGNLASLAAIGDKLQIYYSYASN